jgi:hypothetical protein
MGWQDPWFLRSHNRLLQGVILRDGPPATGVRPQAEPAGVRLLQRFYDASPARHDLDVPGETLGRPGAEGNPSDLRPMPGRLLPHSLER